MANEYKGTAEGEVMVEMNHPRPLIGKLMLVFWSF